MTGRTVTGSQSAPADSGSSGPADTALLLPRRRPGHLGPVHVTQLLLAEAAIVATLTTLSRGLVAAIVGAFAGVLLLLVALGRHKGRWWLERRLMTRRYRRRRSTTATFGIDDPRLALLSQLAPGLTMENVSMADGTRVGVARDDAGWYAVAVAATDDSADQPARPFPLDVLAATLADADQPGATLQILTHTVPAPGIDTHPSSPVGQSYRQLLAGFGAGTVPADQTTWIAVRLDARLLAEAVAGDRPDLGNAPAVVAALVRRVAKSLRRVGISHRLLDSEGLLNALLRSCDLAAPASGAQPVQPREEWSAWHSSRLAHRSFWIRKWPPIGEAAALLGWLSALPAAMTSVALILSPFGDAKTVDLRTLVRIAAPADQLDHICEVLIRGARQAKADVFPLDGEQGPAAYASAPTGGGAR